MSEHHAYTRRSFISRGLILASAAASAPAFIQRSAWAFANLAPDLSSIPGVPDERVLVVIQLSGGNDGLNTVIPVHDREYHNARPGIGVRETDALPLDRAGVALHPALASLRELHDEGLLATVQGVGYPNPNRSHFLSMDIWHTARDEGVGDGWIGRFVDSECPDNQQAGVALGRETPLAMQGRRVKPISFESAELFRWTGDAAHPALVGPYERIVNAGAPEGEDPDSTRAFLMRTALDARIAGDQIRTAVAARPLAEFPRTELGEQLRMVSSMIRAGLRTRVYYVSLGGFDTHSGQGGAQGRHAALLRQYADALKAFYDDLRAQANDARVLTLTFSEFGRRVRQNASGGTDHGAAAPLFLAGPMVRAGVLNDHPSLSNLDDGDLRYQVDFRSIYAAVLSDWLKADHRPVLAGSYRPFPALRRGV